MSIFPKRTIPGSEVTIHWNLSVPPLLQAHCCPFVRIGVTDPAGQTTMLLEEHIPVLPSVGAALPVEATEENKLLYLNKNTPLLLLASYLSGRQKREKLVGILQNIQAGRHYYFTYPVPANALPGKYTLLSELYMDGLKKYSGTVAEDFFFVEKIGVNITWANGLPANAILFNHSAENTPVKILKYLPGATAQPARVDVFELPGHGSKEIMITGEDTFLCYNEERILIPLYAIDEPRCLRNQQLLFIHRPEKEEEVVYVMHPEKDISYRLAGGQAGIWLKADGLATRKALRTEMDAGHYDEMLANGLIIELT